MFRKCPCLGVNLMRSQYPFLAPAGLDIGAISDDPSGPPQPVPARGSRQLQEEPLDVILSPELDKMVTDGEDL